MKAKNNKRFQYPVRIAKPGKTVNFRRTVRPRPTTNSKPSANSKRTLKSELVAKYRQATKLVETANLRQTTNPKRTMDSKQIAKLVRIAKSEQTAKLGQADQVKLADQIVRITQMEALFTKCEETVRQLLQALENKAGITPDRTNFPSVLKDLFDFKDLISAPSFLNSPAQSFDFNDLTSALSTLETYYTSPAWRTDFEADEAGLLPPDLKRGVLSEDGIYNLLEEYKGVEEEVKEMKEKGKILV